jgi:small subunit ribosomal protein S18
MAAEAEQYREEGGAEAGRRRPRGRFSRRRKVCMFCAEHVKVIDYKDVGRLRRFLSERARIEPGRKLGTCAKHQRALSQALKRARHLALLPYTGEHIRATGPSPPRQ